MKKIFIFSTCFVIVFVAMLFKGVTAEAKNPDKNFEIDIGDVGITTIDITSSEPVTHIRNFNELKHTKFGLISSVEGGVSYDKEEKKIYQSNWTSQKPISEFFDVARFDTYKFEKYVDIPVRILHSRKVAAGDIVSFTIQTTQSVEENKTITSTIGTNRYFEYCGTFGFSMGKSLALDVINLVSTVNNTNTVKIGGNVSEMISITKSSTTSYSVVYEETFTFDNRDSSHDTYFDMNFRQKFQIYFTTRYDYNYKVEEWGSGLFNADKNWSYTVENYTPTGTYVYLIPIENPYFEVSKYYDNYKGLKEIIKTTTNNNIVYI